MRGEEHKVSERWRKRKAGGRRGVHVFGELRRTAILAVAGTAPLQAKIRLTERDKAERGVPEVGEVSTWLVGRCPPKEECSVPFNLDAITRREVGKLGGGEWDVVEEV